MTTPWLPPPPPSPSETPSRDVTLMPYFDSGTWVHGREPDQWGPPEGHRDTAGWVAWFFLALCCPWRWRIQLSDAPSPIDGTPGGIMLPPMGIAFTGRWAVGYQSTTSSLDPEGPPQDDSGVPQWETP